MVTYSFLEHVKYIDSDISSNPSSPVGVNKKINSSPVNLWVFFNPVQWIIKYFSCRNIIYLFIVFFKMISNSGSIYIAGK